MPGRFHDPKGECTGKKQPTNKQPNKKHLNPFTKLPAGCGIGHWEGPGSARGSWQAEGSEAYGSFLCVALRPEPPKEGAREPPALALCQPVGFHLPLPGKRTQRGSRSRSHLSARLRQH